MAETNNEKEIEEKEMITMYIKDTMTYEFKIPKELEEEMGQLDVKQISISSDGVEIGDKTYKTTGFKFERELMYVPQLNLLK